MSFSAKKKGESRLKKHYQTEQQRAVQQFRRIATEQNPNIQMILSLTEIVALLQQGVGNLLRETGLALMQAVMEEEIRHLAGERHEQHEGWRAHRWGKEDGYCIVDGQKVPIRTTRLRTAERREQRLGSYELFQRSGPMQLGVWDKMMRGLSTRNYGAVVKEFHHACGSRNRDKRELHRSQPGKGQGVDGTPTSRVAIVRHRDRRHAVLRSVDDRSPWDWLRWTQNGFGIA